MAIVVHTDRRGTTMQTYREALRALKDRGGTESPPGMLFMLAYGDPDDVELFVAWENREAFEKFYKQDMPASAEASGIDAGNLDIQEVQDIVWAPQLVQH
jgi:heme-degrading monooxygenase HmoA